MASSSSQRKAQTVCLMILATVAGGFALHWLRPVLIPFVLALFFVAGVNPVLAFVERRLNAPRMVAVVVTFLLGLACFALLWLMIWASVLSLLKDADMYRQRIVELADGLPSWVLGNDSGQRPEAEEPQPGADQDPAGSQDGSAAQDADADPKRPSVSDDGAAPTGTAPAADRDKAAATVSSYVAAGARTWLAQLIGALTDFLSSAMMVVIFMLFLLLGGTGSRAGSSKLWIEIDSQVRGYIVTKTIISVLTGAALWLVLWAFGVPLSFVFGVLAFLLNFIPNIGPIIAGVLPLPLVVLNPDLSVAEMVIVMTLSFAIQFVSGNIVEPKVMGDSTALHPIAILLMLMIWGMIWGIVGMFLATPLTAAAKIVMERFEVTRPIALMLAGDFSGWAELTGETDSATSANK